MWPITPAQPVRGEAAHARHEPAEPRCAQQRHVVCVPVQERGGGTPASMKGGKNSRFGKGGLSDKRRARSRSTVPRGPDCDRRRRGASVEEVDDDCDLVMGDTGNPRLVRLASAPAPLSSSAGPPSHPPFSCRSPAAPKSTQPRARRAALRAVLWCGGFLGSCAG